MVHIYSQWGLGHTTDASQLFGLEVIGKSMKLAGNALFEKCMKKLACT